jgi:hypothetical protein
MSTADARATKSGWSHEFDELWKRDGAGFRWSFPNDTLAKRARAAPSFRRVTEPFFSRLLPSALCIANL